MAITIKCPKCGLENQLGRIFCHRCGSKLEFSEGSFQEAKIHFSPGRLLARLVRVGISMGLLAAIVLMCMPVTLPGRAGTRQDVVLLDQKIRVLRRAVLDGRRMEETVREAEVNGYLDDARNRSAKEAKAGPVKLDLTSINIALRPDRVALVLHAKLGPVTLSFEVQGKPAKKQNRFSLDVVGGRIGHLPLPAVAADWVSRKVSGVFSKMERERQLLDDAHEIVAQDGQAVVKIGR